MGKGGRRGDSKGRGRGDGKRGGTVEKCGNVENSKSTPQRVDSKLHHGGEILTGFPHIKRKTQPHEKPCTRQVYASEEVAERTARKLLESKIRATVDRCKFCGMLHLTEIRTNA